MIITTSAYYTICGIIAALALLPILYGKATKASNKFGWTWVFLLLLIPINWFTPAIYDVTDCGAYTKKVLILPNSEYSLGRHNYIINNSDKDLFFEYLFYGNDRPHDNQIDMIIAPGTTYKAPVITINYIFEPAPSSVKIKGDGATHYRLSCDIPNWEEYEKDFDTELEAITSEQ